MRRFLFVLLAAGLVVAGVEPAAGQTASSQPVSPSQHFSSLRPLSDVPLTVLPEADLQRGAKQPASTDAAPGGGTPIRPYRYGVTVDAGLTPASSGAWERADSGEWVWRLRLQSRDARSTSVSFSEFDLPPGARLFVRSPSGDQLHGPYTAADATAGSHRTPLVRGDVSVVELVVPDGRREAVRLTIGQVVHGFRSVFDRITGGSSGGAAAKDGACNLDVVCPEGNPWFPVYRSVAAYTFVQGQSAFVCTGSLVNNTAEDRTPYFLTAEHCVSTPETVTTMVFHWNYQSPVCRDRGTTRNAAEPQDEFDEQTSTGALLRARYGNNHRQGRIAGRPDLALVEIDDEIPESYGLYFAGWDRSGAVPDRGVTVHHPAGSAKRISFDDSPLLRTAYAQESASSGDTHWLIESWELGTTEGGSSGAPLYNDDQQIVGVLSGGAAGCVAGSARDNNQPDWYGSLAAGFTKTDFDNTTFADLLDPMDTGTQSLSGMTQTDDTTPPARISDLRVIEATGSQVRLSWTAPGDDGRSGRAHRYDLVYKIGSIIRNEEDFNDATLVTGVPDPADAGTRQTTAVQVETDSSYYFAIRAVDDTGRRSPIEILRTADGIPLGVAPVEELRVRDPYPNPTDGTVTLEFSAPESGRAEIDVYDSLGRLVKSPLSLDIQAGRVLAYPLDLSSLASGIYFVRLQIDGAQSTVQVSVVK